MNDVPLWDRGRSQAAGNSRLRPTARGAIRSMAVRHKAFLSYHQEDREAVREFISEFDEGEDIFITRGITVPDDVIDSTNPDYVMGRIRELFLRDSTVTIVLIGKCTWARRFVDWEVQASLRQPAGGLPNGLMAVLLNRYATSGTLPDRVKLNVDGGYANFYSYPAGPATLRSWIETAYQKRTSDAYKILNPRARQVNNKLCT